MKSAFLILCCLICFIPSAVSAGAWNDIEKAATFLDEWQLEDAYALTEKLLREQPNEPQVWVMAARVQHARGEHLSALSLLRAAQKEGLDGFERFTQLVEGPAKLMPFFGALETEHFKIRYINKDEIVAVYAKDVLEKAYQRIGTALDFLPAEKGEKITVEILPNARALAESTGLRISEIEASGTIAVCKFHRLMVISPLAAVNGYDWASTLAHEFTHLVISKRTKNKIPIWLHEAIAKYFESLWSSKAGEALSPFGEKLLKEATEKREWISFAQMHPSMAKLPTQKAAALAFAEVFSVVEFLEKRYGQGVMAKILRFVGQGKSVDQALNTATQLSIKSLETKLHKYLEKRKFKLKPGAVARPIRFVDSQGDSQNAPQEGPLEAMPERRVHEYSRLGEMLEMRNHFKAAVLEYEKAYAFGGKSYASLVYRLAKIYRKQGMHERAAAIVEKGLLLHKDSTDLLILAGRIALDAQDYTQALDIYEKSRYQNPFNPEIHSALSHLYGKKKQETLAAREKHFLALASRPRTQSQFTLPTATQGEAFLSVITPSWRSFRLDAEVAQSAPAFLIPVAAGKHSIEYINHSGQVRIRDVVIKADESKVILLD